ncbi:MAG: NUDIX domain-containing protein [Planctomycetes bacterium]|nr:NUDIX domain-containing protein [Planctomycetota bacterium]
MCLVDVRGGRVLMGRRLRDPWSGRTSFPGGGVEPGEAPLEAARRELREETALTAPARPWFERVVYAGDARQVLRVHCFVIPCLRVEAPTPSDEFAGEWLTPAQARARCLTPSAACVLDAVARWR